MAKPVTSQQVLARMRELCNTSERCVSEIVDRLARYELTATEARGVLKSLVAEGFVDDARYARAFAHDRLRFSLWGRYKIAMGLRAKKIDKQLIDAALEALDEDEYRQAAMRVMKASMGKCRRDEDGTIPYPERMKALRRAAAHGFEIDLLNSCLFEINS